MRIFEMLEQNSQALSFAVTDVKKMFYCEKYFILGNIFCCHRSDRKKNIYVYTVSSPFNRNLKLTFIEFTVATKGVF